ncbi:hypothetical protein OY671_010449 [Metschnikowia pulcherrima]|nr:hypothetical protein OY671_010449 [Metschnikowia pulcherrima]
MEMSQHAAGFKMQHVPYKGSAPASADSMGGHSQFAGSSISSAASSIKAGKVRASAVTSAERSKASPDVPTIAEAGVPGYDVSVWWGVLGPANMPPEIVSKLETDSKAASQDPGVLSTLSKIGAAPVGSCTKEFDAYMHAEATKWEPVSKAANIRAQ